MFGFGPADFNVRVLYKVVSVIDLSSFALSFFHHHVSSPLHNTASAIYIFAGKGGGELSDIQVTSYPDKNAGVQDVRLYQYVNYRTLKNRIPV